MDKRCTGTANFPHDFLRPVLNEQRTARPPINHLRRPSTWAAYRVAKVPIETKLAGAKNGRLSRRMKRCQEKTDIYH